MFRNPQTVSFGVRILEDLGRLKPPCGHTTRFTSLSYLILPLKRSSFSICERGWDGRNRLWPNRLWPNRLWPKPTLAKTDFGQSDFGQNRLRPNRLWPNRLWPKPTLAKPTLAKTDFGQTDFGKVKVFRCLKLIVWIFFNCFLCNF